MNHLELKVHPMLYIEDPANQAGPYEDTRLSGRQGTHTIGHFSLTSTARGERSLCTLLSGRVIRISVGIRWACLIHAVDNREERIE